MSTDREQNRFKTLILGCLVFGGRRDVEPAKRKEKGQPVTSEGYRGVVCPGGLVRKDSKKEAGSTASHAAVAMIRSLRIDHWL